MIVASVGFALLDNQWQRREATCVGLMLVIFSPDFDFTNSLLIKIPTGCLYFRPLGAVSSTTRSDILLLIVLKVRMPVIEVIDILDRRVKLRDVAVTRNLRLPFCMRGMSATLIQGSCRVMDFVRGRGVNQSSSGRA